VSKHKEEDESLSAETEVVPEAENLSEPGDLQKQLDEQKAKYADVYDQLLRLNAEFQNFRKRSELRIAESRKAGKEDVLIHVINLHDALLQAESTAATAKDIAVIQKGITMLREQFEKFLTDQGLVAISAKGEPLDPLKHEAILRVPSADHEEGTVVDEIQRGYMMNGQIVRPARVSVAAKI
jgi:molecular chaperone GrpE